MNMQNIRPSKYLKYLVLPTLFGTQRTKEILVVNPTAVPAREEADHVSITVFDYNTDVCDEKKFETVDDILTYTQNNRINWINIDGLRKVDVETVCNHFGIRPLLMEDILSISPRPKVDVVEGILFCLLVMLCCSEGSKSVGQGRMSSA